MFSPLLVKSEEERNKSYEMMTSHRVLELSVGLIVHVCGHLGTIGVGKSITTIRADGPLFVAKVTEAEERRP
jgi:hypothetical protein